MSVRQFRILNKDNKYLDFLDLDVFAHKPEGLGIDIEHTFYNSFNSFSDVAQASKQSEMKFEIILGYVSHNAYLKYNDMLRFLNVGGLKLEYTVPNVGTFIRDVSIGSITKKDLDEYDVLQEEITFLGLTPWYSWVPLTTAFDPLIDGGIVYDDNLGLLYDHTAWGWGELVPTTTTTTTNEAGEGGPVGKTPANLTAFSTRYPRFNMLAGTRDTITFKGRGGPVPESWHVNSAAKAEIINVYDSDYFKAGMHITSDGEATVSMKYTGIYNHGDKYVQSYDIRNQGTSPIIIKDKIIAISNGEHIELVNVDGSADESWTIPADGQWHICIGTGKKFPDNLDLNTITEMYSQAYCAGGTGTDFVLAVPKLEIGQWGTPWLPLADEIEDGDYPTHYGISKSNEYNDSEVTTDYTWLPLTDRNDIVKRDGNHSDLQDALIHKAYSWSADGTKGFTNDVINPNVFNEADLVTGFLASNTGEITSSGVTSNHQTMQSKITIPDGATVLIMTVYNPNKVAQTSTNTNRIGFWNKNGSYNTAYHQLPLITADEYQVHNIPIPSTMGQLRIGVIHGPAATKTSDWKFKFEFATKPSPYTPWVGAMRNPNLLVNSSVHNTLVGGTPTVESPNYLMNQAMSEYFKAGDSITLSYELNVTWPAATTTTTTSTTTSASPTTTTTTTIAAPTMGGKLIGGTYKPDFPSVIIKSGVVNGRYEGTITLDEDFIVNNPYMVAVRAIGANLPAGMSIEVYNLKIENSTTATAWIANNTETDDTDYPSYQGLAVNHTSADSSDPTDYVWRKITDFSLSDRIDQPTGETVQNELNTSQEQQGFNVVHGTNVTADLTYPFVNRLSFNSQLYETGGILFVDFNWEFSGNEADMKGQFNPQFTESPYALNDELFEPVYITPSNLSGRWSKGVIITDDMIDWNIEQAKFFGFRMDNCADNGTVTISNMKLQYYPKEVMFEHLAFAWSADGVKRFTSSFPKPNLLQSSRLTGSGVTGADSGIALPFDNANNFSGQSLEAGDVITMSFDWSAEDTANQFAGRFIPTFITYPLTMGNDKYVVINDGDPHGHYEASITVTQTMIDGGAATTFGFMFDTMDGTETVSIDKLKLEVFGKGELGYGINSTPWMPGQTEALPTDYPNLVGAYTDDTQQDSTDSTMYSWSEIDSPETIQSNDQPSGLIKPLDGIDISPYRIVYNDTTIYQADYSKSASFLQVTNESMYFGTQEDSSFRITIKATEETGNIVNPSWYLTNTAGKELQTEGFLLSIPVGFELVVSSDSFERTMVLRDSSGKLPDSSVDELMDPTVSGWIRVPLGVSRIVLGSETYAYTGGFNGGRIIAEYKQEWIGI